jgi:hypothetical protein
MHYQHARSRPFDGIIPSEKALTFEIAMLVGDLLGLYIGAGGANQHETTSYDNDGAKHVDLLVMNFILCRRIADAARRSVASRMIRNHKSYRADLGREWPGTRIQPQARHSGRGLYCS